MFRKTIAVLLLLSIVLSSCGKPKTKEVIVREVVREVVVRNVYVPAESPTCPVESSVCPEVSTCPETECFIPSEFLTCPEPSTSVVTSKKSPSVISKIGLKFFYLTFIYFANLELGLKHPSFIDSTLADILVEFDV